jgi:hypothetical protein
MVKATVMIICYRTTVTSGFKKNHKCVTIHKSYFVKVHDFNCTIRNEGPQNHQITYNVLPSDIKTEYLFDNSGLRL